MSRNIDLVPFQQKVTHDPTQQLKVDVSRWVKENPYAAMTEAVLFGAVNTLLTDIDTVTGLDLLGVVTPLEDLLGTNTGLMSGLVEFLSPTAGTTTPNVFTPLLSELGLPSVSGLSSFLQPADLLSGTNVLSPLFDAEGKILADLLSGSLGGGGEAIDALVQTWLGLSGTGYTAADLTRAAQSIPASFMTGTLQPGLFNNISIASLTSVIPELLTNGNFNSLNSLAGQQYWTWDGTQGPPGVSTSVFADALGELIELYSNAIHVSPGQVLNIFGNTKWGNSFNGGANSIALTVAKFDATGMSLGYDTLDSVATPGASGGWTTLSDTYTVPASTAVIFVRPIVSAAATVGRVWFGKMSAKPTATTLSQSLVNSLESDLANLLPTNWFETKSQGGVNLVLDGSLENATVLQASNGTVVTEQAHSGTHSMKLVVTVAGQPGQQCWNMLPISTTEMFNPANGFRVQPGQTYYVEMWVMGKSTNTAGSGVGVWNYFNNSVTGDEDWNTGEGWVDNVAGGFGWTKVSGYATVPAGMDRWIPYAYTGGLDSVPGQTYYIDDAVVREETASQNIIDTFTQAFNPTLGTGNALSVLESQLVAGGVPYTLLQGIGGPMDLGGSMQQTWNQWVGGAVNVVGGTSNLADVWDISNYVSAGSTMGRNALDTINIRNNESFFSGLLHTGTSSVPYSSMMYDTAADPSASGGIAVTASNAPILFEVIQKSRSLGVISWEGFGNTSITDFRVRVWKMNILTEVMTRIYDSPNIVGDVATGHAWNNHALTAPIQQEPGEAYGYEICVAAGTGTHRIAGKTTHAPTRNDTFPRGFAAARTTSIASPPATIASGSIPYSTAVPHIEAAVEISSTTVQHSDQLFTKNTVGSGTIPIGSWVGNIDYIIVPAAGGGSGGSQTLGFNGDHGDVGSWIHGTWVAGTHFTPGSDLLSWTCADGGAGGSYLVAGAAGSPGGTSSASVPGAAAVTAPGGGAGSGLTGDYTGPSPGNDTYRSQTYSGGLQQGSAGGNGNAPGGAGAGGGYYSNGGKGAHASLWFVLRI